MNKSLSSTELTAALIERGLLPVGTSDAVRSVNIRPWYIEMVLGGAGWFAGLFALVFVSLLFRPETPTAMAISGGILLVAAFGLYKADSDSSFFDQLALAFSIAGQSLVAFAIGQGTHAPALTAGLVALMQVLLLLAMPNRLARLIATLFACVAWALAIRFAWWGETSYWHDERTPIALGPALLGWCLAWVPLILLAWKLIAAEAQWLARGWQNIARPGLTGLLVAIAFGTFASQPAVNFELWGAQTAVRENWLALWPLLSVGSAAIVMFAAWLVRSRALLGVGIVAAALHVGHFYFLLGVGLLTKACIMLAVGLAMIVLAYMQRRTAKTTVSS